MNRISSERSSPGGVVQALLASLARHHDARAANSASDQCAGQVCGAGASERKRDANSGDAHPLHTCADGLSA